MSHEVDSFKHVDFATRKIVESWIRREPGRQIPFTPLAKPLRECKVALLSSAGLAHVDDRPFDQEGERREPWWGDPSHRVLGGDITTEDIRCHHLHINHRIPEMDMNCALPLDRLKELAAGGMVRAVAPRHFSTMGYVLNTEVLESETAPAIAEALVNDAVDVVVLGPV
jgi:D-proline reductase (dithiol) PrdB